VKEASPQDAGEVRFGHFQLAVIRGVVRLSNKLCDNEQLLHDFWNGKLIDATNHEVNDGKPTNTNNHEWICLQQHQQPSSSSSSYPSAAVPLSAHPNENSWKEMRPVPKEWIALENRLNAQAADQAAAIERLRTEHREFARALENRFDQYAANQMAAISPLLVNLNACLALLSKKI